MHFFAIDSTEKGEMREVKEKEWKIIWHEMYIQAQKKSQTNGKNVRRSGEKCKDLVWLKAYDFMGTDEAENLYCE